MTANRESHTKYFCSLCRAVSEAFVTKLHGPEQTQSTEHPYDWVFIDSGGLQMYVCPRHDISINTKDTLTWRKSASDKK